MNKIKGSDQFQYVYDELNKILLSNTDILNDKSISKIVVVSNKS
jgi:hypothetical protein